jgi:hypothetical protein
MTRIPKVEVDTVNEAMARIEAIIGRRVKRDIRQMTEWAKGNLARAAEAIVNTPNAHVGIVTGFYIQHAEPPSLETDGLVGMTHLAAGLANAGIPVTVITDAPCAKAVWAVVNPVRVIKRVLIGRRASTCKGGQVGVGDLGLEIARGARVYPIAMRRGFGHVGGAAWRSNRTVSCKIAQWRAAADEDGHYCFAVAL